MTEKSEFTEEELCTCCPYGFHIHVDFVKFADDQLSGHKTSRPGSVRISTNSHVVRKKSKEIRDSLELNSKIDRNSKLKHLKRENAFIQQKIIDLQTCTIRTNEEIYGSAFLQALKEFENFIAKTWGRNRCGREKYSSVTDFDKLCADRIPGGTSSTQAAIDTNVCSRCQNQCPCSGKLMSTNKSYIESPMRQIESSSKGVNTEIISHLNTATNTQMERSEQLSKLTIRTQHPSTQSPDCGGEGTILTPVNATMEEAKWEEIDMILDTINCTGKILQTTERFEPEDDCLAQKYPSDDMKQALKLVNDALLHGRTGREVTASMAVILNEWFLIAGSKTACASDILKYLDTFKAYSHQLLRFVVNIPDLSGITVLHYAVSYGNFPVVSKLIDTNVSDPNKPNKAGYTSIMLASLVDIENAEEEEIVRKLIGLSNVNTKAAQHGQTALMLAASHGRFKMVQLLLEAGAEVNAQDEDGSTALMCAVEHGHADIVQCLLAQPGCDPSITDNDGLTALNVAMEANHKDIAVLLYAHMHFVKIMETPVMDNSSLFSKRSRSATNDCLFQQCDADKWCQKSDNNFVARKQHSSIN